MAVNVEIRHMNQDISVLEIAKLKGLKYGVLDNNYTLDRDKIEKNTILYDPYVIARGIEVSIEDNNVYLSMSLPTTSSEILLFYELVECICHEYDYEELYHDKEQIDLKDIYCFIELDKEASLHALLEMEQKLETGEMNAIFVFGALNPITLGKEEFKEINGTLEGFESLLDRLQQLDVFYAGPLLYQRSDSSIFGVYFVGEDIQTVVPLNPDLPFHRRFQVESYYVMIPDKKTVRYEDFINHVKQVGYYDENHIIISLNHDMIEDLVINYSVDVTSSHKESKLN